MSAISLHITDQNKLQEPQFHCKGLQVGLTTGLGLQAVKYITERLSSELITEANFIKLADDLQVPQHQIQLTFNSNNVKVVIQF